MSNPKISVIIPVYNAESTLRRCVDSVLAQTFTDFECLLINDGSKDKSGEICDEYAAKDSRVRVFHKENGGVSSARNVGLDNATGEWIAFVDSDDWVGESYLGNLIGHYNSYPKIELVVSFSEYIFGDKRRIDNYEPLQVNRSDFQILFSKYDMSWHTGPWAKLYKKRVIDGKALRFNEDMNIGEDAVFFYTYLTLIDGLFISSDTDYRYIADADGSLTKKVFPLESEMASCRRINEAVDNLLNIGIEWGERAMNSLSWLKATYMRRVLTALYHNKVDRKTRRSTFMQMDGSFYATYVYDSSFKGRILTFLVKKRWFVLYDFLRKISVIQWSR